MLNFGLGYRFLKFSRKSALLTYPSWLASFIFVVVSVFDVFLFLFFVLFCFGLFFQLIAFAVLFVCLFI